MLHRDGSVVLASGAVFATGTGPDFAWAASSTGGRAAPEQRPLDT